MLWTYTAIFRETQMVGFKRIAAAALMVLAGVSHWGVAQAQETFPARAITMIVPFAPGGGSDVVARIVGEEISKVLGQSIIFENVAGAGGTTGIGRTVASKPDGYTIVIGNAGNAAAAYTLYPALKYGPDALRPLGIVAYSASVIALKKDMAVTSVADFIALAKNAPDQVRIGHAGVGSSNHLICLSFLKAIGLELTMIGYRGGAPALTDALGGHIEAVCDNAASVSQSIVGGQLKGLVVAGGARLDAIPNMPHAVEAGIPAFQAGGWNGLFAPAETPDAVVATWNAALRKALASDTVKSRFQQIVAGIPPGDEQSTDFQKAFVAKEIERYRALLADAKKP
jgi:tripartite-type tricarboxylate transporter receptor subunit TctC